ncbi:MAG: dihydroorotate dehydrogenase electron transfer subunit [Candidatus Latescibacteria bacterium]|nr:dihydroorotate dehydrogenase electron transfer subunit [Candidatus Latescibacterota bacterium]
MKRIKAKIVEHKKLAPAIYSIWLQAGVIAGIIKPGQFVMLTLDECFEPFLARPLSVADTNRDKLRLIYRVVGKGTRLLQDKKTGESLYVLGPLGKPVKPVKNKKIVLCAGGLGIAPLLFLAKKLSKNNKLTLYFGARTKRELILLDEFMPLCEKISLATDDGSQGKKGLVTDLLIKQLIPNPQPPTTIIFAAGPLPMLQKISNFQFPISNLKLFGFLEERMGCGCGICFGCGVKKKDNGYVRTCTDGPVFDLNEIEL